MQHRIYPTGHHRRKVTRVTTASVVVALLFAGCSTGGTGSSASTDASEITVAVAAAPLSLDPAIAANTADNQLLMSLAYEPLIHLDSDGELSPGLAESWKYTDDTLTTFEFTLRDDAMFSDGTVVDAQTAAVSIEHAKTADGPAAAYADAIESATAIDARTVELKLVRSNPTIAFTLTQRFLIGQLVGAAGTSNPDMLGTQTIGAGPYMLDPEQTVSDDHYTFVPNPHYYDPEAVHFTKFTVRVIANAQTALNALTSGQVSYVGGSFASADQAKSAGMEVYSAQSAWYAIFLLDRVGQLVPALADQRVRQALNYAVDREAIASALFGEYGEANVEISIPGYEDSGYVPDYADYYTYDPEKAKQLLAEAGLADGFEITIGASPVFGNGVQMAQAVADYWQAIGVTTTIRSFATIGDIVGPWSGSELPATAGYFDAQPMYIEAGQALVKDAGLFNPFEAEDPELTSLIDAAYAETDEAAVPEAWAAVERRVVELGWFVPLVSGANLYFASPELKGVELSSTAFVPDPTRFHY